MEAPDHLTPASMSHVELFFCALSAIMKIHQDTSRLRFRRQIPADPALLFIGEGFHRLKRLRVSLC
jgi:hypothetical protein